VAERNHATLAGAIERSPDAAVALDSDERYGSQ
jgi:hypothetical protein